MIQTQRSSEYIIHEYMALPFFYQSAWVDQVTVECVDLCDSCFNRVSLLHPLLDLHGSLKNSQLPFSQHTEDDSVSDALEALNRARLPSYISFWLYDSD